MTTPAQRSTFTIRRGRRHGWAVGVDFGGTNIKIGLVDSRGTIVRTHTLATRDCGRPRRFVEAVGEVVEAFARTVNLRTPRLIGTGIGAPGQVDAARGIVRALMNVPGWHDVPLARLLARRLGCPCVVDNDAKLFTLAEWQLGAGRGTRHLVGLTLGTGVGGGIIAEGRLVRGASNTAGELGHVVVTPQGRRCGCGRRGCLEAEVGTAAILSLARAAMRGRAAILRRVVRTHGGRVTPELVTDAARRGDRAARRIWHAVGCRLGMALVDFANALNPERIVIGGGIANAWPFFAPAMTAALTRDAIPQAARTVRIARAQLGNSAGILGAVVLVWNTNAWSEGRQTRGDGR